MSSCWNILKLIHDARNDEHKFSFVSIICLILSTFSRVFLFIYLCSLLVLNITSDRVYVTWDLYRVIQLICNCICWDNEPNILLGYGSSVAALFVRRHAGCSSLYAKQNRLPWGLNSIGLPNTFNTNASWPAIFLFPCQYIFLFSQPCILSLPLFIPLPGSPYSLLIQFFGFKAIKRNIFSQNSYKFIVRLKNVIRTENFNSS
jgi:hypothetical protein